MPALEEDAILLVGYRTAPKCDKQGTIKMWRHDVVKIGSPQLVQKDGGLFRVVEKDGEQGLYPEDDF